jgi:hypothetical protein
MLEAGDRGWGYAGTLPSYPKGIPDVQCGGRRVSSTVPSERCEAPEKGAASRRGAGLTAIIPPINWRGKGR